ncbi:sodium/potassium/calcium exchanger 1-like, partial [Anarrhichthys ocellatus]|uniref:sodium/potassium/calcium exchanger 1-like n=1 Tax=Anarrhichthys ocellatus TaxID=433405 RepID=UPI0012EDADD4
IKPRLSLFLVLLSSGDAFSLGSSQRVVPLGPPVDRLFQPHFIQEIVRTKRHSVQELVRAQPHLVHDMGRPEIHETSRSQAKMDAANSSQLQEVARTRPAVEENLGVEDEMERMVHLVVPQEPGSYKGGPDSTDPERELLAGPGAGDASLEASGFYGTDMEDRDRGEEGGEDRDRGGEGGEDRERRGGEGEWERDMGEDKERRGGEDRGKEEERRGGTDDVIHTSPDLDALIGYTSSVRPSPPTEGQDSGLMEHRSSLVLEVGPVERDLWEADGHSSGYGGLHSSITTASTSSTSSTTSTTSTSTTTAGGGDPAGTDPPETDTGTDFGLLGSYTKEDKETERDEEDTGLTHREVFTQNPTVAEGGVAPSREPLQPSVEEEEELEEEEHRFKGIRPHDSEEEEGTRTSHIFPLTTGPAPTVGFTTSSWDWLEKTTSRQTPRSEVRGGGVTEENRQVMCVDWSKLSERGYVLLNTTDNLNCV